MRCRSHVRDDGYYEDKWLYGRGSQRLSDWNENRSCSSLLVLPLPASLAIAEAVAAKAERAAEIMVTTTIKMIQWYVESQVLVVMVQKADDVYRRDTE